MDIKLPPNTPPQPPLRVLEQLGAEKSSLIDMVGQIVKATVIKTEQILIDGKTQTGGLKPSPQLASQLSPESKKVEPQKQLLQAGKQQFNTLLRIGLKEVTVTSEKAFITGSQIDLKVINGGLLQLQDKVQPQTQQTQSLIGSSLREILPHQQVYARLLNTLLSTPSSTLEKLPTKIQQQISEIIKNLPQQNQVQQAEGLKKALKSSGFFLENKLFHSAIDRNPALRNSLQLLNIKNIFSSTKPTEEPTIKPAMEKNMAAQNTAQSPLKSPLNQNRQQLLSMIQNLIKQQSSEQAAQASAPTRTSTILPRSQALSDTPAQGDFKADIARLVHSLTESLPNTAIQGNSSTPSAQTTIAPGSPTLLQSDLGSLLRNIAQLIKQQTGASQKMTGKSSTLFQANAQTNSQQQTEQQTNLQQSLLRHALATLVRTQLHQLSSVQTQANPGAENPIINHWIVELPVVNGEKVDTFNIEVTEEENTDREDKDSERQWRVMLGFELDNLGSIYVQLILVADTVSATVWAEQQKTLRHVKAELQTLHSALTELGVEVKQLDCHAGKPPDTSTRLEQQLIDIHT